MSALNELFGSALHLPSVVEGGSRLELNDAIREELNQAILALSADPQGKVTLIRPETGVLAEFEFDTIGMEGLYNLRVVPYQPLGVNLVTGETIVIQIKDLTLETTLLSHGFGEYSFKIEYKLVEGSSSESGVSLPPSAVIGVDTLPEAKLLPASEPKLITLPAAWKANQPMLLFPASGRALYPIATGSYNATSGSFSRSGPDVYQGVLSSFATIQLDKVGERIEATFDWLGGGSNNSSQQVLFGFFKGPEVSAENALAASSAWEGYFVALGSRSSNGDAVYGVYRQGSGDKPLFNHPDQSSTENFHVDGNGYRSTSGFRPPINQAINAPVTLKIERTSEAEITLTVQYATERVDGSASHTFSAGGHPAIISVNTIARLATLSVRWSIASGGPLAFNGIAFAGTGTVVSNNFTLRNLQILAHEPRSASFDLSDFPEAKVFPGNPDTEISLPSAQTLPGVAPVTIGINQPFSLPATEPRFMSPMEALYLPGFHSPTLNDINVPPTHNNQPN